MNIWLRTIVMNLFTALYAVVVLVTFIFVLPFVFLRDKIELYFSKKKTAYPK